MYLECKSRKCKVQEKVPKSIGDFLKFTEPIIGDGMSPLHILATLDPP